VYVHTPKYVGIAPFEAHMCVNDYIDGKMCASKDALALSLFAGVCDLGASRPPSRRLRREVYVHTP